MKVSQIEYAKRRALQVFDEWLDVTGLVERHSGYYDELCSLIETAVDIGSMVALEVPFHINDDGEAVEDKHEYEDKVTKNVYNVKIVPCTTGPFTDGNKNAMDDGWTVQYTGIPEKTIEDEDEETNQA